MRRPDKRYAKTLIVSVYLAFFSLAALAQKAVQKASEPYPAGTAHTPPAWFEDVAPQANIKVINVNGGVTSKRYILEATGSGVAIFDYDNDGYADIFLVNGAYLQPQNAKNGPPPTSHLFHNNHDGTFTDVTANSGLADTGWGQGACVGDYDNDGLPDLYVTSYGKNRLYHNEGRGRFHEVAEQAGVAGTGKEWGTGCAFVDYDRDGKLDIAVANYVHFDIKDVPEPGKSAGCMWKGVAVMCGPRGLEWAPNILYHNLGNGKFEDVSVKSGFTKTTGHYCFSVSTVDADEDGWPDIYVACDSTPAILYRNNHDGTFTDRAPDAGVAFNEDGREQAGMGSTLGDYDGDGHLDIFKTNFSDDTATLYHAHGDGIYEDVTYLAGLGINTDKLGWGTMFLDIDNDGWPDIISANGHVYPEVDSSHLGSDYRESRLLYHNLGNGKFADITKDSGPGITTPASARGLAIADLWNDGRQEVVINDVSSLPMLLVNRALNTNHWIGLTSHRNQIQSQRHRRTRHRTRHRSRQGARLGQRSAQRLLLQFLKRLAPPLRPRPLASTARDRSELALRPHRTLPRPTRRPHLSAHRRRRQTAACQSRKVDYL